jgi:hypothetical protein
MRAHFRFIAVLVGTVIVLYSPVLLHAHWGLFDDASLILQPSRRLMDDPSTISYILGGQLRMGIYYWVTLIWRLFPENPTGFFATNCLLISVAITLLYATCYRLTGKARLSCLTSAAVLASPSLFEVIYTLDKQEVYFPFLFSSVIFAHLLSAKCKLKLLPMLAMIAALCSTCCYLSKETGVILCLFSGALLFFNLLFANSKRLEVLLRNGIVFLATLGPLLVLKLLVFPPTTDSYVVMTFNIDKLIAKTWQYAVVVPDFFLVLTYACASCALMSFSKKAQRDELWCAFLALLLSSIVATAALISFDTFAGVLLYIWLPIYFLLLPCLAYSLHTLPQALGAGVRVNRVFVSTFLLLLLSQLPTRILQAQFQFSMDALTSALSKHLSKLTVQSKTPVVCAMPTYTVGENEVPEQIETHVRSILQKNYYENKSEKTSRQKFTMLNFLSPDCENEHQQGDQSDIYRLAQFRGRALPYTNECPLNYVGWTGFQILNGASPFQTWVKRPYGKDDLLIVPYGELAPNTILYRGAAIFTQPWKLKLLNFPQLTFEDVGHVERKLTNLIGHRKTIGWRTLRVKEAEPVALCTSTDGWLKSGAKVFYQRNASKPILQILINQPSALILKQTDADEEVITSVKRNGHNLIDLPLKSHSDTGTLQLRSLSDDQRLHVDKANYVAQREETKTPLITTVADGWLSNNGVIVYSAKEVNKNLCISTLRPYAPITIVGKDKNYDLNVDQGKATIALIDGKALSNGLFYLRARSSKPLIAKNDGRQVVIHCDSYWVE